MVPVRGERSYGTGSVPVGYEIFGSLGQPAIGLQNGGANQMHSGIWPQIELTGAVVGIGDRPPVGLKRLLLGQNYPNPFRQTTRIPFSLPVRQHVSMQVFGVNGREVAVLVDEELEPGQYEVQVTAGDLAPGIYFYRFQAGTDTRVRKLLLLR